MNVKVNDDGCCCGCIVIIGALVVGALAFLGIMSLAAGLP